MGGSSSGGTFSSDDMKKMQEAAEARLRVLASQSTKILFICEDLDSRSLQSHLSRSSAFKPNRTISLSASQSGQVDDALEVVTFLVPFTNETTSAPFIDGVMDKALLKKLAGVHVQGHKKSFVPSKIAAYRWRSITWDELEAIFQ
jgi:hypothetical protein